MEFKKRTRWLGEWIEMKDAEITWHIVEGNCELLRKSVSESQTDSAENNTINIEG